ncbi:MAG TPA: PAS domain-containing protein [Polyangia bacterium]
MSTEGTETGAAAAATRPWSDASGALPLDRAQVYQAILDSTNLATYLKDCDGRYVFVNRQYELLSKVPREVIAGKVDADLFPEAVARLFREQDLEVMARRTLLEFEETIPLPDGVFSFITAKFPLIDDAGRVYAVGGVCTDITTRQQRSDETLAGERERLAVTLRSIGDGVISTDTTGSVALLNPAAARLTGWSPEDAAGRALEDVFRLAPASGGAPVQPAREALARGVVVEPGEDLALLAHDGTRRLVTASAAPVRDRAGGLIGAVLSFRDVTEQRRMAEELFNARKLESVGILAGGIAHDFNNILEGILGNINLAQSRLTSSDGARQYLAAAEKAALRARGLTRQLLTFSRGGDPVKEVSCIAGIMRDAANLALGGSAVSCRLALPADLWPVAVDRAQLSQVFQNLVINARHAMPGGGTVTISGRNVEGAPLPHLPPGRYVRVVVADRGGGIPADILDKIFDPYFTTKEGGSGLGLAVAFSVIQKHAGRIVVESREGEGATFTIDLPAAAGAVAAAPAPELPPRGRGGRVLIMDDDEDVLEVTGEILAHLGFEALFARDGREAIAAYQRALQAGVRLDLVIMDLTVPGGMGGVPAVREILAIDPDAKVIVSSGYCDDPCLANHRAHGFVAAAVKPYTVDEMRAKIASVLG